MLQQIPATHRSEGRELAICKPPILPHAWLSLASTLVAADEHRWPLAPTGDIWPPLSVLSYKTQTCTNWGIVPAERRHSQSTGREQAPVDNGSRGI